MHYKIMSNFNAYNSNDSKIDFHNDYLARMMHYFMSNVESLGYYLGQRYLLRMLPQETTNHHSIVQK